MERYTKNILIFLGLILLIFFLFAYLENTNFNMEYSRVIEKRIIFEYPNDTIIEDFKIIRNSRGMENDSAYVYIIK